MATRADAEQAIKRLWHAWPSHKEATEAMARGDFDKVLQIVEDEEEEAEEERRFDMRYAP